MLGASRFTPRCPFSVLYTVLYSFGQISCLEDTLIRGFKTVQVSSSQLRAHVCALYSFAHFREGGVRWLAWQFSRLVMGGPERAPVRPFSLKNDPRPSSDGPAPHAGHEAQLQPHDPLGRLHPAQPGHPDPKASDSTPRFCTSSSRPEAAGAT